MAENINQNNLYILRGSYENNLLNELFFSNINIKNLQKKMVNIVSNKYNYEISPQSKTELINIMRNVYLTDCKHNYTTKSELKKQLNILNKIVLKHCINIIKKNIDNYIFYINDINTPNYLKQITPMDRPSDTRKYNNLKYNDVF